MPLLGSQPGACLLGYEPSTGIVPPFSIWYIQSCGMVASTITDSIDKPWHAGAAAGFAVCFVPAMDQFS